MQVVIDTQTVLDWQFFANPICQAWPLPGTTSGGWAWMATAAMRAELQAVLGRPWPSRWQASPMAVLDFFDAHARLCPAPGPFGPALNLRCTDPDDQKFIDLALHTGARWLLSRDRAVLKLAGRARRAGLLILPPARWALDPPT